jgi:hypothetical protein
MTTKPKPAAAPDWRDRERALLARRREIAADLGTVEGARVRLQVELAGSPDPRIDGALATFRKQAADLRAEDEDVAAALEEVGRHRAAEDATERAHEREIKRHALGLLLDRRARHASAIDALLAAIEHEMAELRETAPIITRWAHDLGLGDLAGFGAPAEAASVTAAVCAQAPTLAGLLGVQTMTYEPGQRAPLARTEAWRGTGVDRRITDGREKDAAARARVEAQAEHTAAVRTARAEAAAAEARA